MESRRKRSRSQILKWCCYVLGLFVCAALQTMPGLFQFGAAKPLWLLPLCLAVSAAEGEFAGAIFGAVCGLMWDYTAGRTVGMLALELMILCFGVSVVVQLYLKDTPSNFVLLAVVCCRCCCFIGVTFSVRFCFVCQVARRFVHIPKTGICLFRFRLDLLRRLAYCRSHFGSCHIFFKLFVCIALSPSSYSIRVIIRVAFCFAR